MQDYTVELAIWPSIHLGLPAAAPGNASDKPVTRASTPHSVRRMGPAPLISAYAFPSDLYSRRKPSNRRRWPSSSWRMAMTMSWVTGSLLSQNSMIWL
jgi:hypothetical protein